MHTRIPLPMPYGWYCVGFSSDIDIAEVKPVTYFGEQLVLYRTATGQANLSSAFCPHLGAHLGHGGKVEGERIVCPFHGWKFNTAGVVEEIPYAHRIPPKIDGKACLYSYPVVEKNDIIYAWYHPDKIVPLFEVVPFDVIDSGQWSDYETHEWDIKTHIQETGENAVDGAHFITVHLAVGLPIPSITYDGHRRTSIFEMQTQKFTDQGEKVEGESMDGHVVSECSGPGQTWTRHRTIADLLIIGLPTPIDANTVKLRFACSVPKTQVADQKVLSDYVIQNAVEQVQQDMPIWEHKIYLEEPQLCDGDGPIAQYRKWFSQFYRRQAKG
jgi:3-ketosteroid 9alpha-monooxygenase subunit A